MNNQELQWAAWHLHGEHPGPTASDQLVRHVVGPAVRALETWGHPDGWFFVRYWQNGPHIRLRVAGLDRPRASELHGLLERHLAARPAEAAPPLTPEQYRRQAAPLAGAGEGSGPLATGELWPAGVYRQRYVPEGARYGGADLMAESESLFHRSSHLALAFLRLEPPEAARCGLGLRATQAALGVVTDERRRYRLCRQAAAAWGDWVDQAGLGESPAPTTLRLRMGRTPPPVESWAEQLARALARWREARGEEQAERILLAHIHMLHNRLGLSVVQERNHYVALARQFALGATVAS